MPKGARRNVYTALGAAGISATLLGTVLLLTPARVGAFWPFTTAEAADGGTPILHDPSLNLLAAALNTDPNPSKGDSLLPLSEGSALIANSGPDGTLPDPTTADTSDSSSAAGSNASISVYTVKDGDSISGIASQFGISVNTILWANDLTIKSTIKPGMTLVILPVSGTQHTVASGETLSSIATKYSASAQEIATFNGLDAGATVVVGSTLVIPGGEVAAKAPATVTHKPATTSTKTSSPTHTNVTNDLANTSGAKATAIKVSSDLGAATASSGYYENPVPGAILYQGIHGNNAVDLSAPSGTPIHAAAAGTVIISKGDAWNGGYGSYVVVSHSNGSQTLYAHMSSDISTVGETVAQGQLLGYVGETGEATGNHLHFEVRGAKNPFGYSCDLMSRCY